MPKALPNISTIKILTKRLASFASARAQLLPDTPTHIPLPTLVKPDASPAKNTACAAKYALAKNFEQSVSSATALASALDIGLLAEPDLLLNIIAIIRPYIAVASQKITLIRFFDFVLGAFTDAPTIVEPVKNMPHAAPIIERTRAMPGPTIA